MCDINLLNTNGGVASFSADYEDCNNKAGVAQIDFQSFDQNNDWKYLVEGTNTDGNTFSEEVLVPNGIPINPTKVFNYIAKKIKEVLCPTCS